MNELQRAQRTELTVHDGRPTPTRTDQAVAWVGWHIAELAAIGLPLLLAVTVSWWWVGVSVLAGTAWIAHEVVTTRRLRTSTTDKDTDNDAEVGRPLRAVPATRDRSDSGEGIA